MVSADKSWHVRGWKTGRGKGYIEDSQLLLLYVCVCLCVFIDDSHPSGRR